MSLILKQESEGSIPTPASGKGVIYINTSGELAVKKTDGSATAFGNITAVNLDGNVSNVLAGDGTWIAGGGGGSYGNSNVASFLANLGSNQIYAATGNIQGGNLNTNGNVSGANLSISGYTRLGSVANIQITGGSAGQVLSTDGTGNLSWAAGGGGSYGDSNVVSLMASFGSNTITTTGNVITGSLQSGSILINQYGSGNISGVGGMFVGYLEASSGMSTSFVTSTGGLTVQNGTVTLGSVGNVKIAGGTSGYVLSTDGAGNLSWISGGGGGSANLEQVDTDILPIFDSIYDIGSNTARFYDMFLGNDLDINGATLTATTPLLGGNAVFTTSNDVVLSGALLADLLLITDNIITPDASTARQYMGSDGVVVINGDLDVDGDWFGTPVVQTIEPVVGYNAGELDTSIDFGTGFDAIPAGAAAQSDGKILFGGQFTSYNGTSLGGTRFLVRVNADGTLDSTFNTAVAALTLNSVVSTIVVLSDDSIIIGGQFTSFNGNFQYRVAKLTSEGLPVSTFNNNIVSNGGFTSGVNKIVLLSNGTAAAIGPFTQYAGQGANYFTVFNTTTGAKVDSNPGFNSNVYDVAVDANNRIYCVGAFAFVGASTADKLARLTSTGVHDTSFTSQGFGTGYPNSIAIQDDLKIIVGGQITQYGFNAVGGICRIDTNGLIDYTFDTYPGIVGFYVYNLLIQSDGKVIAGGLFTSYAGNTANSIVRIDSDGSYDSTFDSGTGFSGNGPNKILAYSATSFIALPTYNALTYDGTAIPSFALIYTATEESIPGVTPPTGGEEGFIRYNQDITAFQAYNGTSWELLERVTSAPSTLATTGTVDIDFTGSVLNTQGSLTGDITYTGSNYLTGSSVTTRIVNGATERTLTFPTGWVFVGTEPTTIAAGKTAILTVTSFGTTEADCVAAWAVQG